MIPGQRRAAWLGSWEVEVSRAIGSNTVSHAYFFADPHWLQQSWRGLRCMS